MDNQKKINVINNVQPIEPDSLRIGVKENVIKFEFGEMQSVDEQQENLNVLSSIRLNPKYLQNFMLKVVEAGVEYEKIFHVDIGFAPFWKPND